MEKFTNEIADKLRAWIESAEAKEVIEATEKAADTETGTFEVVITTADLDRYREVVSLDGWELEHYRNNPVVLWGHDHNKLIGICTDLAIADGKMIAKGKFAPTEEAQEKRKLYDQGFLKATSVGFIEKEREGNLISKAELLEFSFVSVPANPYALSLAMEKEVSINELVTKGIFTLNDIKDIEEPVEDIDPENDETEPTAKTFFDDLARQARSELAQEVAELVIKELKNGPSALEEPAEGLERTEPEVDEEEKALADFSAKRKTIQEAATILGEVLAEARKAIEVQK